MAMQPNEVSDRSSFVTFLQSFRNEFDNGDGSWTNRTLPEFLDALESYAEDVQGYYDNVHPGINADVPSWRVFADILKGATMQE